jgi:hypothetical protein
MRANGFSQFLAVRKIKIKILLAYIKSLTVLVKIIHVTLFRELFPGFYLPAFPLVTLNVVPRAAVILKIVPKVGHVHCTVELRKSTNESEGCRNRNYVRLLEQP